MSENEKTLLSEQYKSDKLECGYQINIEGFKSSNFNEKKFNAIKCLKFYLGILFTFLMTIGGSIITIIFSLGKTINASNCSGEIEKIPDRCGGAIIIISTSISSPLIFLFWQFPPSCCRYNIFCCMPKMKNTKNRAYLTMILLLLVSNMLVTLAHALGYPCLLLYYEYNSLDSFTYKTSFAGFILYYIITFCMLAIFGIYVLLEKIYRCTKKRFYEEI